MTADNILGWMMFVGLCAVCVLLTYSFIQDKIKNRKEKRKKKHAGEA